jgi:hypothetical protein
MSLHGLELLYQNILKISTDADKPKPAFPLGTKELTELRIPGKIRVLLYKPEGLGPCFFEQVCIADDIRGTQVRKT